MIKNLLLNIDILQVMMVNYMYDINLLNYHYDHEEIVEVLNMIDMEIVMFQLFDNVFQHLYLILNVVMEELFYFHYDLIVCVQSKQKEND
jgi:hypothetical protein